MNDERTGTRVAVLGGGAMGTCCAAVLADNGVPTTLWTRDPANAADLRDRRENARLLPGVRLHELIDVTADPAAALRDADRLVVAVPTKFLRAALAALAPHVPAGVPAVSVVKGIEFGTFTRPSEVIRDVLGPRPVTVLGGPCHAEEAARRCPSSVVAASDDAADAEAVQTLFTTDRFRVYTNADPVGVELAGALKNVIAIAAGICDGLELGDNAKSALMTRGLAEVGRFGAAFGADPATFAGLAGVGDLITSCVSGHGRNRRVGERLGRGESPDAVLADLPAVAEGVNTVRSVLPLAERHGIDLPIAREVHAVLFESKPPAASIDDLMTRPPKGE